jgi:hypothetical protein
MEPTELSSAASFNLAGCFVKVAWTLVIALFLLLFALGVLAGVVIAAGLNGLI